VEVDAADGAVMFFELLEEGAHSVVENLNDSVVEGCGDPRALGMEGETLDAVAFGLEFYEKGVVLSHGGVGHERGRGVGWRGQEEWLRLEGFEGE
jgi:hypothetical protein